jgi:hypothetical protein
MFIPSEDHRFFSKLSCEDHDEIVWSGGGSSSSSEDDVRAAALNNGSFADSVGLLPALPETSSSSSDGFSQCDRDIDESDGGEDDDRKQLYPKGVVAQHRTGILRLFGARQRMGALYSDSSTKTRKKSHDRGDTITTLTQPCVEVPPVPNLSVTSKEPQALPNMDDDAVYGPVSNLTGLPVVTEEDDLQLSDRKSDEMMSQSSVEHVLRAVTQNMDEEGDGMMHPTPSWDSYSFSSHGGGSRSRTKIERKKKKKSHRIPSSIHSSTTLSHHGQDETIERMEKELEARLDVILHLKDTVVKQHEAMEQMSKTNTKLKAKLRIATKSLKVAHNRINEDAEIIQRLELELKALK